jgi:hypothetical protein
MAKSEAIEVVVSFDTTGSMFPCLTQVRREVKETVTRLFKEIPNIRIGIIAHGDYCDAGSTYVTKQFDLSDDPKAICKFVETVGATGGGDAEECYELVLHQSKSLSWSAGKSKVLVLMGDDVPHGPNYAQNTKKLDWRNELDLLSEAGIKVYGVQCLNRKHATKFYEEIARKTGGFHLSLDQFSNVTDLIMAVCYQQAGDVPLQNFEQEVEKKGGMNRSMHDIFNVLMGRKPSSSKYSASSGKLRPVPGGRFQALKVSKDVPIADFVRDNGLTFKVGRGFYEFTKKVTVQDHKEVILMDKTTGDFFSGDEAREIAGIPVGVEARVSPEKLDKYVCFIQSTSPNRKLLGGTKFLYEVSDWAS